MLQMLPNPLDTDLELAYKDGQYYLPNDEVRKASLFLCAIH